MTRHIDCQLSPEHFCSIFAICKVKGSNLLSHAFQLPHSCFVVRTRVVDGAVLDDCRELLELLRISLRAHWSSASVLSLGHTAVRVVVTSKSFHLCLSERLFTCARLVHHLRLDALVQPIHRIVVSPVFCTRVECRLLHFRDVCAHHAIDLLCRIQLALFL